MSNILIGARLSGIRFAVALMPFLLSLRCGVAPTAGNGTQTGNPTVTAMLYNPGGAPAAHARVRFFPVNYNPHAGLPKGLAAVDSTNTDANGNYHATLDSGTYNVLAAGDSGVVFQDSITVIKDSTVHPAADTLGAPGSIRGVVRLQPGDDARTVFMLFLGTNIWATPDDSTGRFTAANMAGGTYRVRILTTLDLYVPKDTVLSVTAGKVDTLPHDIVLQYTGIPVPNGLKISYDTLKQIVTLTWNKPTTGRTVAGYDIYRKRQDSTSFVKIAGVVADTVYKDSTAIQDQTYEYRVTMMDSNGTEGVKSAAVSIKVVGALILTDSIISPMINSSQAHAFIIDKDSTIYVAVAGPVNFVRVLSRTGDSINAIGEGVIRQVYDIALGTKGDLFVVDPDNSMVFRFLPNGQLISSWPVSVPTAIAIDSADNTYVVFSNGLGILKFDAAGQHVDSVTLGSVASETHLAIAPDGRVFVGRLATNSITVYDGQLSTVNSFQIIAENHLLIDLQGIDRNGNLYVRYVRNVQPDLEYRIFNASGAYVAKLQTPDGGDFSRILGSRLYLMSQKGISIYSITF